jgi:CDP-glycerol glycerophosphotransferase
MSFKDKLRKFNRKLRNAPLYDRAYLKLRRAVKGEAPPPKALYYHTNYTDKTVVPGRVLLDSFWGRMIGCNSYAVYLAMRDDPRCADFEYIWVCNDNSKIPDDMVGDPAVSFVAYQSILHQDAMLTAQYLIANCNFPLHFAKKPEQIYVNVWHGTPLKHIGLNADDAFVPSANTQRNYLCSDFILSYSPVMTERTVVAYGASGALDRVYEIGTPRIDLTLTTPRADVREMLGVSGGKDVLLYAPTWRGDFHNKNTDIQTQIDIIREIQTQFSATHDVFISVHHIMATALDDQEISFRTIPSNIPINIVLSGVDILVSDYSSITVDYLSLDRPVALFCPDYAAYRHAQGLHDNLQDFPAAFCETLQELKVAIEIARKPSDFETYAHYKSLLVPLEDGKASSRGLDIFLNKVSATAYPADSRTRILFYAGGLMGNGITSSIIALTNAINHEKYHVTIVFDAAAMDKDIGRQINLRKFSPHCHFVTRTGVTTYTAAESEAYARFRQMGVYQSAQDRALIDDVFKRETRRIFGEQHYDVAIDFSGYGPFWSLVLSHVNAKRRLIYQHNDMKLEAYNPSSARSFPELPAVFSLYERYDGIVAVTSEILDVNRANLRQYYRDDTAFYAAQNVISEEVILRRGDVPLALVSPLMAAVKQVEGLYLFCCVARLSPEKNHSRLLNAFAQVLKSVPDCALVILGSGKLEASLKKKARRLGISDRVLFLGHQDNPYAIIKACDCKVLSSHYEGQGIVLLEALTLGVKCIATDNPAIRNVLKGGVGTIVPKDTSALANAMVAAARTGKTTNPPFDAASYAVAAVQQFYRSLGTGSDQIRIIANRTDGLGERLNAMLNGLWLSERFGCDFKFSWSDRFADDPTHAIDTPENTFSESFLKAHYVPHADVSHVKELKGKERSFEDLTEELSQVDEIAAPRVALSEIFDPEAGFSGKEGLKRAFQRIGFAPHIAEAISCAEDCNVPDNAVALHLRSGDIFFGQYRKYLHYTYKGLTLPLAKQIIKKFTSQGQPVYIFGQDKPSITYLCETCGAQDGDSLKPDSNVEMNATQTALYDLVLLSRFKQIVGGSSGFSKQAGWIGASEVSLAHKMFSAADQTAYAVNDLRKNAETYHPLQSGIGYWYAYFYGRGKRPVSENIPLLQEAFRWDPDNELYGFILAALFVEKGDLLQADKVLEQLFQDRMDADKLPEIFRVFAAKTVGSYNLKEYFPAFETLADTSYWAARLMLRKAILDKDTAKIKKWETQCADLGTAQEQSLVDGL